MRRAKRERGHVSVCEGMGAGGAREARRRGGRVRAGQPLRGDITRRRKTRSTENLDRRRWNAEGRGAEAVSSRTWNGLGSARSSKGLSAMVASVSRVERGLECTTEPPKVASLSRSQTAPPTNITRSVWAVSLRSRINQATVWKSPISSQRHLKKFGIWTSQRCEIVHFHAPALTMAAVTMPAVAPEVSLDPKNRSPRVSARGFAHRARPEAAPAPTHLLFFPPAERNATSPPEARKATVSVPGR